MSGFVQLIGAESVERAGHNMQHAAEAVRQAASQIDDSLLRHQRFLDDWLARLEDALTRSAETKNP